MSSEDAALKLVRCEQAIVPAYQDQIEAELTAEQTAWFVSPVWGGRATPDESARDVSFFHPVFDALDERGRASSSPLRPLLEPLLLMFCAKATVTFRELLRIDVRLFPRTMDATAGEAPHVDLSTPHTAAVYFVNASDGDTTVFAETCDSSPVVGPSPPTSQLTEAARISPRRGSMVCFDGRHYRAAAPPTQASRRIEIRFAFV